ncbi:hypothetical protein BLOT_002824 [Blomia tropicalis]|nr:hypothetical protein BLOT_002824 [Blomia tropicalis]
MENKAAKTKKNKSQSYSKILSVSKASSSKKTTKSKSTSALPRSKNDHYKVVSKTSLLQDVKNTAVNGYENVKSRINSISTILKNSKKSKSDLENYNTICNEPTPIKLYSPFTIESPPIVASKKYMEDRDKLRQHLFASPQNKIRQDVEQLESGLNELNLLTRKLENSYKQSNQK